MSDVIDGEAVQIDAPTDNLVRSVSFRAEKSEDGLTLEGYGAVFNADTTIDSYEGQFVERIAPGAFKRTLGQRMPVLQFDHGQHPLIGSLPIGTIRSIREDDHGLKVRARLADNWLVEPVRDAIRDGAITGMSFRFRVLGESWEKPATRGGMPTRTITEVELYEVGPVVFPAYEQTSVGVRSATTLDALQDPEVRAEIARILASGTDLRSLAQIPAPDDVHAEIVDAPADGHASTRTRNQRTALAVLTLNKETPA